MVHSVEELRLLVTGMQRAGVVDKAEARIARPRLRLRRTHRRLTDDAPYRDRGAARRQAPLDELLTDRRVDAS